MYINYLVLGSKSLKVLEWLKNHFIKELNIENLEKIKKIIGYKTKQDLIANTLKIDQKRYI